MPTLIEERATALKSAGDIANGAKASARDLSADENAQIKSFLDVVDTIDVKIKNGEETAGLLKRLGEVSANVDDGEAEPELSKARSLGEQFAKSGALAEFAKGSGQRTASAPEFKAATDPFLTSGNGQTQYGQVVATRLRRLTIADLLSQGSLSASSLTYWQQGAVTGAPAAVAEGATKPSINFAFAPVTEALAKVAGITKVSTESVEDTDYIVSVINGQLVLRLQILEEDQILSGSGAAPQLRGLLNRSGVQTYGVVGDLKAGNLDKIFHAMTLVSTGAAFLPADGIVINPVDYEALRLSKDGQQQYYAGGPFTGAYGEPGAVQTNPGLWGMPTVVTPAIPVGTVLVGAFAAAAQLFRKGGIRVDSTNSDVDDFQNNRVALRAEERILLAVYYASAFCKVTLGTA